MAVNLPRDIRAFLSGYRGLASSPQQTESSDNLEFYRNRLRCQPDGLLVEEILDQWKGDYNKLESGHGYIQWLFPIQEDGMNFAAQRLMPHELSAMRADAEVMRRIVRAYTMMLDFYGMRLQSEETGLVGRALPPGNYSSRYVNLLFSPHNNLRISRILKCLSELGLEHLNAGFLLHVLNEQSEHEELTTPFIRDSMDRWWANCIRNDREREWIRQVIARVRSRQLVFTRQMYENVLEGRRQTGEFPTEVLDRNAS
ncbi:opioid growth factor receptor conserved region-domain-containing protein [Pisolithus croceorrhizus]|nr:opioid growth factor receptor conserved region-domain-containing protein [Pisolithus croceorrhizus]KAI6166517.1 opioid growth factor receptor conserved region-domain-containing protein [Pisolithus thermaeus]